MKIHANHIGEKDPEGSSRILGHYYRRAQLQTVDGINELFSFLHIREDLLGGGRRRSMGNRPKEGAATLLCTTKESISFLSFFFLESDTTCNKLPCLIHIALHELSSV